MRLEEWLQINKITPKKFAMQVGKSPSLIHKYLYEDVIPKVGSMQAIYRATYGVVTANDFYALNPDLIKQEQHCRFDGY